MLSESVPLEEGVSVMSSSEEEAVVYSRSTHLNVIDYPSSLIKRGFGIGKELS